MSINKKFVWLKLKDNFFNEPKIKKLRRIAGGDTYTVIYLKMMLLSIKNGGLIEFQGIEKTLQEELSLILDESDENIQATLIYLEKMGMIEPICDQNYLLPNVPELIGSESDSTERVRRLRDRRKEDKALHCNGDVTDCNEIVTTEREKEKEEEREEDKDIKKKERKKANKSLDIILPDCIIPAAWDGWVKYRKERKLTCLTITLQAQANSLQEMFNKGINPNKVIEDSIKNGWQGLFEPKQQQTYQPKQSMSDKVDAVAQKYFTPKNYQEAEVIA